MNDWTKRRQIVLGWWAEGKSLHGAQMTKGPFVFHERLEFDKNNLWFRVASCGISLSRDIESSSSALLQQRFIILVSWTPCHHATIIMFALTQFEFQKLPEAYEEQLRSLKQENLIDPNVNISMFYQWREGRQESEKNPFFEWLQLILGITTTTASPPLEPPTECAECRCGKSSTNKIVGGTETGVNQYPWMAMLMYSNRFYCGATLINDRYVMGENH